MILTKTLNLIEHEIYELTSEMNHTTCSKIELDFAFNKKLKGIYDTINKYKNSGNTLIGEGWVPRR